MNNVQWNNLLRVIRGELVDPVPVGLIVDSPWLPQWAGVSILDYFHDPEAWLRTNFEAADRFNRIMLLPGFWSEYGMCTEPSAFGAKCVFWEDTFPSVERTLHDYGDVDRLVKPDCRIHGLLPFVLKRLTGSRSAIERRGHHIRFAVARGPLNVASYLLGHTELLVGIKTEPEKIHQLLTIVTDFLVDWIGLQKETLDSIDGIFLLDDLIGFLGEADFQEFVVPYFKTIFASQNVSVRFLHNDARGEITGRHLSAMGVNLFNFSFQHSIAQMRQFAGEEVVLLGNIPPRDVLAAGTPDEVRASVVESMQGVDDLHRVIISCGGGAPPGAPTENLVAMCEGADLLTNGSLSCSRGITDKRS